MIPTPGQIVYFIVENEVLNKPALAEGVPLREMVTNIRTWKVQTADGVRDVHQDNMHESRELALLALRLDEEAQAAALHRDSEDVRRSLAIWDTAIQRHSARAQWAVDELLKDGELALACAVGGCDLESGASCGHCTPADAGPQEQAATMSYRELTESLR